MRFAASVTEAEDLDDALAALTAPVESDVTRGMVDLVFVFVGAPFREEMETVQAELADFFPTAVLIGATMEGAIGVDREVERRPCLSLLAACLPEVTIRPFFLDQRQLVRAQSPADWERLVGAAPENRPVFITLADPFRFGVLDFLEQLNEAYPGCPVLGGMASAGRAPRENRLFVDGEVHDEGAVGVALSGRLRVDTVVSQGCRPIGRSFVTTKAERNVIRELGGKPALHQLHRVLVDLPPEDEELARQSLFMGRVINEYKETFTRGDFLIHNIIGADRESGALAIAGPAKVGATVQFHVRDADSADEDLRTMLAPFEGTDVRGALLFSCNGRGTHMWDRPHHDVRVLREILGDVPVAGGFCGGEFGPVGGRNFVHGFTASIGLFREPEACSDTSA